MDETDIMDEYKFMGYVVIGVGILGLGLIVGLFYYNIQLNNEITQDKYNKNFICNNLDLGEYKGNDLEINKKIYNEHYFKCTKDIYNSTDRKITTLENWVKMP